MSQLKPEYEVLEDFSVIAKKVVDKWPQIFEGITPDEIRCYVITNKERPEKRKLWELHAVPYPIRIDCSYGWYIIMYKPDWDELNDKMKSLRVAEILCGVGEEGKVNPP